MEGVMDLQTILNNITKADEKFYKKAQEKTLQLIMPTLAMGILHDISYRLCAISASLEPKTDKRAVFVMAADHGVVEEKISAFDSIVTCEMIKAFIRGVATISVLSRQNNCTTIVVDVGSKCNIEQKDLIGNSKFIVKKIKNGTNNMLKEPAMSKDQAIASIMAGFEIAHNEINSNKLNLIATGDMGIGNTTPASAIGCVITKNPPQAMTGKGTGITQQMLYHKISIIEQAIEKHKPNPDDPIDILSKVGGIEIAAIAGVILAASYSKVPVLVDGLISTAAALIAYKLNPLTLDYMFIAHKSKEPGHAKMIEYLGLAPILQLDMRLGEGTGAVLAMPIVEAASRIITEVATFDGANVSKSRL